MSKVSVVVLGDIGRSPRMQYHAVSLATEGYDVNVVGYGGSQPIKKLTDNNKISVSRIRNCPEFQKYLPTLIAYIVKTIWQSITLLFSLFYNSRSKVVLVQSPPAIPTLAICWVYCKLAAASFVIDWHNYAYKNMAFSLGNKHQLVRISHWFEGFFGKKADYNFCVTKAMKSDLENRWNISANVLYDKPFESFATTSVDEKYTLFKKLSTEYPIFSANNTSEDETIFTKLSADGEVILKDSRPALLVSSTSWTEDEDFSLLLDALTDYDESEKEGLPQVICVITGKGPLKDHYINLISSRNWNKVSVVTPWLEPEDYPLMIGSADLGVCLHMSTSGLDLPMKVVDMFGSGLPVSAYKFTALPELVQDGVNGFVFETSSELSEQLQDWFKDFPNNEGKHKKLRDHIESNFQNLRWHENWTLHALPIIKESVTKHTHRDRNE